MQNPQATKTKCYEKVYSFIIGRSRSCVILAKSQGKSFQSDYDRFIENLKTPFAKADGEVFVLGGTFWERSYGESENFLTPLVQNIDEYHNRIRQMDNPAQASYKSKFHHVNVEVTPSSKALLETMNIYVPDYVVGSVNVFLPEIDIDVLTQNSISFNYRTVNASSFKGQPAQTAAVLWSEGFESVTIPGDYDVFVNSTDCAWDDVSCESHTGSKSVWSAGNGGDCYTDCTQYPNNMQTDIYQSSNINTSGYQDFLVVSKKVCIWL